MKLKFIFIAVMMTCSMVVFGQNGENSEKKEEKSLLATILASSIVSILLTTVLNSWQSDKTYRKEYYKRIIDKRFDAYEELENLLRVFNIFLFDKRYNGAHLLVLSSTERFDQFTLSVLEAQLRTRWLGDESQKALTRLATILAKIGEDLDIERSDESLGDASSPYIEEIIDLKRQLMRASKSDFENLHDVDLFFNPYRKRSLQGRIQALFR